MVNFVQQVVLKGTDKDGQRIARLWEIVRLG